VAAKSSWQKQLQKERRGRGTTTQLTFTTADPVMLYDTESAKKKLHP